MASTAIVADPREAKAQVLLETGAISIRNGYALVASGTKAGEVYRCNRNGCSCPDWGYRQPEDGCAHMRAAADYCEQLRQQRRAGNVIQFPAAVA